MKNDKLYRFSLSWPIETEDQVLVGEFLETLGNKKSRFIVQLVAEYIHDHPEMMNADSAIQLALNSNSKALKDVIHDIIRAEIASGRLTIPKRTSDVSEDVGTVESGSSNGGLAAMLSNLDVFNST